MFDDHGQMKPPPLPLPRWAKILGVGTITAFFLLLLAFGVLGLIALAKVVL